MVLGTNSLDLDSAGRRSWEPVDQQFEPEAQAFVPASPQAGSQHLVRLLKVVHEAELTVARPVLELAKYHSSDQPDSQAVRIDFGSPPVLMRHCGHVWSIGLSALVSVLVLLDFQTLPWLSSLRKVSHNKVNLEQPIVRMFCPGCPAGLRYHMKIHFWLNTRE